MKDHLLEKTRELAYLQMMLAFGLFVNVSLLIEEHL
jgi:hypothetical protein